MLGMCTGECISTWILRYMNVYTETFCLQVLHHKKIYKKGISTKLILEIEEKKNRGSIDKCSFAGLVILNTNKPICFIDEFVSVVLTVPFPLSVQDLELPHHLSFSVHFFVVHSEFSPRSPLKAEPLWEHQSHSVISRGVLFVRKVEPTIFQAVRIVFQITETRDI